MGKEWAAVLGLVPGTNLGCETTFSCQGTGTGKRSGRWCVWQAEVRVQVLLAALDVAVAMLFTSSASPGPAGQVALSRMGAEETHERWVGFHQSSLYGYSGDNTWDGVFPASCRVSLQRSRVNILAACPPEHPVAVAALAVGSKLGGAGPLI